MTDEQVPSLGVVYEHSRQNREQIRELRNEFAQVRTSLDGLAEKISLIGKPNHSALTGYAAVVLALGAIVYGFVDKEISRNEQGIRDQDTRLQLEMRMLDAATRAEFAPLSAGLKELRDKVSEREIGYASNHERLRALERAVFK